MAFGIEVHAIECESDPTSAPEAVNQHWTNLNTGAHWFSNGTATLANWVLVTPIDPIITGSVASTTTEILDTVQLSAFCAVKYVICYHNATEDKWASMEIMASKIDSASVEYSKYANLGKHKILDFDFIINGLNVELIATNNEAYDIDVRIAKRLL